MIANEEVIHWLPDPGCPALAGHYIRRSEWLATSNPEKVTCKSCDLSITPEHARQRQEELDAYFASVLAAYNAKDRQ